MAKILLGQATQLHLGNLDARRDWGFAGEYVRAMHLMLQQDEASDFVVGTGVTHSVREFADKVFAVAGLDWREHVVVDGDLARPADVELLCADPKRVAERLGRTATVGLDELVRIMVEADVKLLAEARPERRHADVDRHWAGDGTYIA